MTLKPSSGRGLQRTLAVLASALTSLAGPTAAASEDLGPAVEVLGHAVLPETHIDGLTVGEVSGLEWSVQDGVLFGVTDRGVLLTFEVSLDDGGLHAVAPLSAAQLLDARGLSVDPDSFNPEALELESTPEFTRLLIASETGPAAALFASEGAWIADVAPPGGLANGAGLEQAEHGVEAAALHPDHGLLMALEEPPSGGHVIHAADGTSFSYAGPEIGSSRLKAMEVLEDGRILLLERVKGPSKGSLVPYLRVLDPAQCDEDGLCPTTVARIVLPAIPDADFEGLTDLGRGLFLIASDDKVDGDLRTVFVLLRLHS